MITSRRPKRSDRFPTKKPLVLETSAPEPRISPTSEGGIWNRRKRMTDRNGHTRNAEVRISSVPASTAHTIGGNGGSFFRRLFMARSPHGLRLRHDELA